MDAIGMDTPLLQITSKVPSKKTAIHQDNHSFDQMLIDKQNEKQWNTSNQKQPPDEMDVQLLLEELQAVLSENHLEDLSKEGSNLLSDPLATDENAEFVAVSDLLEQGIPTMDSSNLKNNPIITDKLTVLTGDSAENIPYHHFIADYQLEESNKTNLHSEMNNFADSKNKLLDIVSKFESLISQIQTKEDLSNSETKIFELLRQWASIMKNTGNDNNILDSLNNRDSKEHFVWRDLLNYYQKREQLFTKLHYNMEAKVTNKDLVGWLEKAFDSHGLSERSSFNVQTGTPLSKLEQYVIHINQNQSSKPVNQQLLEQFQSVMKRSNFSTLPNGKSHLLITLQPNNLGEMRVRLTQINGEMTVKIIVTTQAVKEMLDGNINQLRNMFSPQQVVIEKQDINTQQSQFLQKEQSDQKKENSDQGNSNNSDQQENQQSEDDFETYFRELLLNEKV